MSEKLARYAVNEKTSKGRRFKEMAHPYRNAFERDRDRIIHSEAFRRLEGKTQVFTPGIDDSYRNRLTHSIEVSQIGRTIAKQLKINETLTEATCLAHDMGHPPFGHIGEKTLNKLMCDHGGFEHNKQTLRVVDLLEHPYQDFTGLNLMHETRLGLARHKSPYDQPESLGFSETNCSLEGQVANIADRIAYNCHDLEDGLRAGLIAHEQLKDIELFEQTQEHIGSDKIQDKSLQGTRTAKAIIDILVSDCIHSSTQAINKAKIHTVDALYSSEKNFIIISSRNEARLKELEQFLLKSFYEHKSFQETTEKITAHLNKLLETLCAQTQLMPPYYKHLIEHQGIERVAADYIAGMTDRFCLGFFNRI